MFERFSQPAIKTMMLAQEEARRLGHNFVGSEQLLLGLLAEGTNGAARVLKVLGVTLKSARTETEKIMGRGAGFVSVEISFTPRTKRILELTWSEARRLGDNYIGPEHLLLGIINEGDGVACRVLHILNVDLREVHNLIHEELEKPPGVFKLNYSPKPDWHHLETERGLHDVLTYAHRIALDRNTRVIEVEDILMGMLEAEDTQAFQVLQKLGLDKNKLGDQLGISAVKSDSKAQTPDVILPLSDSSKLWLSRASLLSKNAKKSTTTAMLLLDAIDPARIRAFQILSETGISLASLEAELMTICKPDLELGLPDEKKILSRKNPNLFNFSEEAVEILKSAHEESKNLGWGFVASEVIFLGILRHDENDAASCLKQLGWTLDDAKVAVADYMSGKKSSQATREEILYSPNGLRTVSRANVLAGAFGHTTVVGLHLLLALLSENNMHVNTQIGKKNGGLPAIRKSVAIKLTELVEPQ